MNLHLPKHESSLAESSGLSYRSSRKKWLKIATRADIAKLAPALHRASLSLFRYWQPSV